MLNSALSHLVENELKKGLCIFPGGETPKNLFKSISMQEPIKILLTDDRLVSVKNYKSNYYSILKNLKLNFSEGFPISYYNLIKETNVEMLNKKLSKLIGKKNIQLTLLGLGMDSHIASIFPYNKSDSNSDIGFLTKNFNENFSRYSLNHNTILSSKKIIFLVTGLNKSEAIKNIFFNKYNPNKYPAQKILYNHKNIQFFCDSEASSFFLKNDKIKLDNLLINKS